MMMLDGGNRWIVAASSYGNDSCALIQWLHEAGFRHVIVRYNNTGWAASWWPARVERMERWARSLGFETVNLPSIGMEQLVRDHRGWPRNGMQFCTEDLKITPSLEWLAEIDPEQGFIVATGVRREESDRRRDIPEWEFESPLDGGRDSWRPLFAHTEAERDALLERAGIKPLPHRSQECHPCIAASRTDLRQIEPERVDMIERIETELGFTKTGKPRVMFRPAKKQGATGIREVMDWARADAGQYRAQRDQEGIARFGAENWRRMNLGAGLDVEGEPIGNCGDLGYCGV